MNFARIATKFETIEGDAPCVSSGRQSVVTRNPFLCWDKGTELEMLHIMIAPKGIDYQEFAPRQIKVSMLGGA
jgi:hypothetical protein